MASSPFKKGFVGGSRRQEALPCGGKWGLVTSSLPEAGLFERAARCRVRRSRLWRSRWQRPWSGAEFIRFTLLSLFLACGPAWSSASEFGVYWGTRDPVPGTDPLRTALADAGAEWTRGDRGTARLTPKASLVWWPGAAYVRNSTGGGPGQFHLLPDLWSVFWAARTNSPGGLQTVAAIEVGNEPDLSFTPDLPDRMAATLKAAWWGLKGAHPDLAVLMPSLAAAPGPYARQLVDNRIIPFTEGWNFHFYGWAQDFGASVASHRDFARRHGGGHLPLWITEYGYADFPGNPGPAEDFYLAQQRAFFESTTMEATALGAARLMAFTLSPHLEGGSLDMGLTAADGSPRPAFTAWLELARRLRVAQPLYRLRQVGFDQTVGWVWQMPATPGRAESWWTMLQSPHRQGGFELPRLPGRAETAQPDPLLPATFFEFQLQFAEGGAPRAVGLIGEYGSWPESILHFSASTTTNLHLLTPPGRFDVAGCRWEPLAAPRPGRLRPAAVPSPVVATLTPLGPEFSVDKRAVAYRHEPGSALTFEVRLHNFSAAPAAGRWRLSLPPGWRPARSDQTDGRVRIAAFHDYWTAVTLRPPAGNPPGPERIRLHWQGGAGVTDQAEIQLRPRAADSRAGVPLDARWQPAAAETGWIEEPTEGNQRFSSGRTRGTGSESLVVCLPEGALRSPDVILRFGLRLSPGPASLRRRVELVTAQREVFRWGEDDLLDDRWQFIEARVGDFTPGIWSHVGPGDATAARYLRVSPMRLPAGAAVELTPVTLIRP